MADTKISNLSAASALAGTEPVPVVQGGATVRSTPAAILAYTVAQPNIFTVGQAFAPATDVPALVARRQTAGTTYIAQWQTEISGALGGIGNTGTVISGNPSTATGGLALYNAGSAHATTLTAGVAAAARTYVWPTNFGGAGTTLTDAAGNGTLSWAASGLTVGTTPIASGTTTRLLYNLGGVVQEAAGITTTAGLNLAIAQGTLTATTPGISTTATWNNAAITFTGILSNITNSASNAASLLMDLQAGGASRLSVSPLNTGTLFSVVNASAATVFSVSDAGATTFVGNQTLSDVDVVLGTGAGTKIGTATAQKLAFYNSTPIVQPVNTVAIDTALVNLGLRATGGVANFATVVTNPGTFAGIYVYDGSTGQVIATGTTPTLLTAFNTAAGSNGLSNDVTPVKASNKITVSRAGTYLIAYSLSFSQSGTNVVFEVYAFNDGVQLPATGSQTKTVNSTDIKCCSGMGYAAIAAGKDIDLRGYHDQGGNVTITPSHVNFTVTRVGD